MPQLYPEMLMPISAVPVKRVAQPVDTSLREELLKKIDGIEVITPTSAAPSLDLEKLDLGKIAEQMRHQGITQTDGLASNHVASIKTRSTGGLGA